MTTEGVPPRPRQLRREPPSSSDEDDGLTSSEWGWIAFAVLAAAVIVGRHRLVASQTLRREDEGRRCPARDEPARVNDPDGCRVESIEPR